MDTTTATTTTTVPRTPRHSRSHDQAHSRVRRQNSIPTTSQPTHSQADVASIASRQLPPQALVFPDARRPSSSSHEGAVASPNTRPRSPDDLSRVSASSSAVPGGPQLRKKPKSLAIQSKPRSKSSSATTGPAAPHLTYSQEEALLLSPLQNPANSSKPLLRGDANPQQQSPVLKRPPASHSSYGVETTCGPPPSYTTRRTYSQEGIRKLDRNTVVWAPHEKPSPGAEQLSSGETPPSSSHQSEPSSLELLSPLATAQHTEVDPPPIQMEAMKHVTLRGRRQYEVESSEDDNKGSSGDERKSEDLFLNIAKVDAARAPAVKADRKRSRLSIPFLSSNRLSHGVKSSPITSQQNSDTRSSQVEEPRYYSKRSSIGQHLAEVLSTTNYLDDGQVGGHTTDSLSNPPDAEYSFGRRNSVATVEQSRASQRPTQQLRGQRSAAESSYTNPSRIEEHIATESTVSTTAPSTVWDELDDLKSRIRKLELTGKLPSSSAAAMSSAERPRTATTVATTMSASPRPKTAGVSLSSAVDGIPSGIQPLLHEALSNAKHVLSSDIYSKLYATASDALQLATMVSSEPYGPSHSINANHERQMRRRTENMCRSMTELAIALTADAKGPALTQRPGSRDQANPPSAMLRSRRYSNDPGDRSMHSRVSSRLDGRRTSLVMTGSSPVNASTDPSLPPLPGLRLGRSSTLTRNRRQTGGLDGAEDEMEASPSIRPASRAMTDLGAYRRPPRDYLEASRDVTSQHPMPRLDTGLTTTPQPGHINTTWMSRRKYASPAATLGSQPDNNHPVTPREAVLSRDGWTNMSSTAREAASGDLGSDIGRAGSGRRSLGFAGRIGSSMSNRLRGTRLDRGGRESLGENRNMGDLAPSQVGVDGSMYVP